ncbi:myosin-IIIb [Trichonephila clavipes]|uniref:Myosin-IIIb n=1 Tax=Trichonephila clavipes TaxID=2585209 RepID=A0A8X6RSL0_TRICX|nr:myosin-IIIb [Trichonephila clavipes]
MDDNARPHRTLAVEELLESEDITRMDWPVYSPDLKPIEHVWDALGKLYSYDFEDLFNSIDINDIIKEILVIIRILSAILLLGDVTYTLKGSAATANNPYLISTAAKNLSVDNEQLCSVICKGPTVEDVLAKRDAWVQFLYLRVFDWIVTSINKQLSFSRLVFNFSHNLETTQDSNKCTYRLVQKETLFRPIHLRAAVAQWSGYRIMAGMS